MKKPLFIAGIIVCTSLVVLFTALHLNESDSHQESEANFRPHIMVRNQIYWLSAYPCNEGISQRELLFVLSLHPLMKNARFLKTMFAENRYDRKRIRRDYRQL